GERVGREPEVPLLAREEPALVVAADGVDTCLLEERERARDVAVAVDQIARHEHPLDLSHPEKFESSLEPAIFAVDVADDAHATDMRTCRGHEPRVPALSREVDERG